MPGWVLVITYRLLFLTARSILENSPSRCSVLKWELILDSPSLKEGQSFLFAEPNVDTQLDAHPCYKSLCWSDSSCFGCAFVSLVCWAALSSSAYSWEFSPCLRFCILPCPNLGKWLNTVANSWSLLRNAFLGACRKCHPKSLNCDGRWCLLAERVRDVDNRWCPCQWHGVVVASFLCPYQGCCFSLWSAQEDVTAHHVLFTFFFP